MRENEFEKQVQQQMSDFNIRPSDEVWAEVERRIRKEKKRRFIIWWPLLFILLAGGIGAGIWFSNKKEKSTDWAAIEKEQHTTNKATEIKEPGSSPTGIATNQNNDTVAALTQTVTNNTEALKVLPSSVEKKIASVQGEQLIESGNGGVKKKKAKQQDQQVAAQPIIADPIDKKIKPAAELTVTEAKNTPPADAMPVADETAVVQKQEPAKQPEKKILPPPADTSVKTTLAKKEKKSSKWKPDIGLSFGRSGIVEGFGLFNSYNYALADALGAAPATASYASSPVRSGISLGAGVNMRKPVSKKLELGLGLGYNYLSNKINVGDRVDSARNVNNFFTNGLMVDNYYRPSGRASNTAYHNQYHFISLSADLSWRIIAGKRFKLDWKNGLQYSRLFISTMLHYDRNLPGYYKDNTLLTKNQVFISTGFSIPLTQKLRIDPFIKYGLTPVLNTTGPGKVHYTDFGIRAHFLLNKK